MVLFSGTIEEPFRGFVCFEIPILFPKEGTNSHVLSKETKLLEEKTCQGASPQKQLKQKTIQNNHKTLFKNNKNLFQKKQQL